MDRDRCKLFYDKVVAELLGNEVTRSFGESFPRHTVQELQNGAKSYRVGGCLNINMYLESFFNVFKNSYLACCVNKRLDRLIATPLKVGKDSL